MSEENIQNRSFSLDGEILFVDKPLGWTSFDIIKKVRVLFNVRKAGHAGTLDPKATGLLILCTGNKTKSIMQYVGLEKEYVGTCELGVRTPSFDSETEVHERKDCSAITLKQISDQAQNLLGKQLQLPPMYSAVKYAGKPLYQYARTGKTVERDEREIEVLKFEIRNVQNPFVDFCIVCSKGTYIRSLIDEFGLRLGCGATLRSLRRTRIGDYHVSKAMTIEQLIDWRNSISGDTQISNETGATYRRDTV
jgi:tRNA pseudouridine55 synthase